jgi:hypothetical protein
MAFKSQLLWTGLGTGVLGSMIAPPGEKRQGFSKGFVLGMGGKALLEHPKVRSAIGADEWGKALKGETGNATSTTKKTFETASSPEEAKKLLEEEIKKTKNVTQNAQQNVSNQKVTNKTKINNNQNTTSQSKIVFPEGETYGSRTPIHETNYETSFLHPGAWRHEKYGSFNDIRKARNAYFEWLRG